MTNHRPKTEVDSPSETSCVSDILQTRSSVQHNVTVLHL